MNRRQFIALTASATYPFVHASDGGFRRGPPRDDPIPEPPPSTWPGRPEPGYDLSVLDERRNGHPLWMDANGRVYGRASNRLLVSDDLYRTTDVLYEFPREHGNADDHVQMVVVPDSGHVLAAVGGWKDETTGRIERLDDDHEDAEVVYDFEYGRVTNNFGHHVHDDIVLFGTYGRSDFRAGDHPNEVILSTDGGRSFERILEAAFHTADAPNLHIHDVAYDPYAERIWVTVGDSANAQIYWSDDLGDSWETIAAGGRAPNLTQVIVFEDYVAFGSDGGTEGVYVWERDGPSSAPSGLADIEQPVIIEPERDDDGMRMYARRSWQIRAGGHELCLMPFGYSQMHPTWRESVVLASVDGRTWYEVLRMSGEEALFSNVIGPRSLEGGLRTLVSNSNHPGGFQLEATVPTFWS